MIDRITEWARAHYVSLVAVFAAALATAVVFSMPSLDSAGVATMSVAGLLLSVMHFAIAIALAFVVLRALDSISRFDWRQICDRIEENPRAIALYFGLRFVAVLYLAGQCLA